MTVFDPARRNVVIFGDSNTYVFGRALRQWLSRHADLPPAQCIIKYRSSSSPSHWLPETASDFLPRFGELWTSKGRFRHGPCVRDALSVHTQVVMIGLGGNASSERRLRRVVPQLLDQVTQLAPRAAVVWRGPPPATRKKSGAFASKEQRLARYRRNEWLRRVLEEHEFASLDRAHPPATGDHVRVFVDLMALHGCGPYPGAAVGSGRALEIEKAMLSGLPELRRAVRSCKRGPWRSYERARDDIPTHVPLAAARDLVDEVLPIAELFDRAGALRPTDDEREGPRTHVVVDPDARIRTGPPRFRWLRTRFVQGSRVVVTESHGAYVFASELDGARHGWTLASNLDFEAATDAAASDGRPWTVVDPNALVRRGPSEGFRSTGRRIGRWTRVKLSAVDRSYGLAHELGGRPIGWTALSNLGRYHKDDPRLSELALVPPSPVVPSADRGRTSRAFVDTYNRIGGLMERVARQLNLEVAAALAVWMVESGGRRHTPGKAIIRFENHLLWRRWGKNNAALFDRHFRFGGRKGQSGKSYQNHQYRTTRTGRFTTTHGRGSQSREYESLELASRLAGRATALQCISIGGPQILISNHRRIGYATPTEMYDAFQSNERSHVLGFFDFCEGTQRSGRLVALIRQKNWDAFGRAYNGSSTYGPKLATSYRRAKKLLPTPA